MKIETAIERLNFMIQQHICYEEELHETEVELEALPKVRRGDDAGGS